VKSFRTAEHRFALGRSDRRPEGQARNRGATRAVWLLTALVAAHPALGSRVLEDDGVPTFLNVFVDGEDIRLLGGLDTEVTPTTKVLLLPAVAGGAPLR